jgi:hypothetical protein
MVQLQDSILKLVHHHTLSNMFSIKISNIHYSQILSCFSIRASVWFIIQPIFVAFQLPSPIFFITFQTRLGLPHFSIACILQCLCIHFIDLMASTSYVVFMATSTWKPMMQFVTLLLPLHEMLFSMWDKKNYMCLLQPCLTLLVD